MQRTDGRGTSVYVEALIPRQTDRGPLCELIDSAEPEPGAVNQRGG